MGTIGRVGRAQVHRVSCRYLPLEVLLVDPCIIKVPRRVVPVVRPHESRRSIQSSSTLVSTSAVPQVPFHDPRRNILHSSRDDLFH